MENNVGFPPSQKCVAAGSGVGGCPEIIHERDKAKWGKQVLKTKTMSYVPAGFSEYGMTNASKLRWGIPPASNPLRVRKGAFI